MKAKYEVLRLKELLKVTNLFNEYRIFYKQIPDIESCKKFLSVRTDRKESMMFEARTGDSDNENITRVGFAQLYPSFSSVSMQKIYILNDLFVSEEFRGLGIGAELITHAEKELAKLGIKKISLKTACDNPAKALYEKLGYKIDNQFIHFNKAIKIDNEKSNLTSNNEITRVFDIDLSGMVNLFNNYRIFYKQPTDMLGCKEYLKQRIKQNESIIYEAQHENISAGFVQLYPSFSSVSMQKVYILNDLYVSEEFRGKGIGTELITYAEKELAKSGIKKISLKTAYDNQAKSLYKKLGYEEEIEFFHYNKYLEVESTTGEVGVQLSGAEEVTITCDM
jgi:ribosomal protein S18 acetylase RimI-like enzyme